MAKLEDLKVYQMAMEIGEMTWTIIQNWGVFVKDTIGKQFVRTSDSIAANIAEGYGRYHYRENRQFCYCARGLGTEYKFG